MKYSFLVEVETDDKYVDAPNADQIANEVRNNLEYDAPGNGINLPVKVVLVDASSMANAIRRFSMLRGAE